MHWRHRFPSIADAIVDLLIPYMIRSEFVPTSHCYFRCKRKALPLPAFLFPFVDQELCFACFEECSGRNADCERR
jgi:hypothetical protein